MGWLISGKKKLYFGTQNLYKSGRFWTKKSLGWMLRPITFSRRVFLCWRWICSPGCHFDYLAEKKPPKYVVFNRNLYILYPTRPVTLEPGQNFRSNWMDIFHFSKKNNWTLEDQHGLFRPQKTIGNIKTERIHLHNHHKVPAMHPDQRQFWQGRSFVRQGFWWELDCLLVIFQLKVILKLTTHQSFR